MSAKKGKGPIFDPGLCRCCGAIKKCRILNLEYESFGQKEVYSDMIMDCFGLLLSHLDGMPSERLICATCVQRVRDGLLFKQQALRCEEAFLQMKMYDDETGDKNTKSQTEEQKIEVVIKTEPLETENDDDNGILESPPRDVLADDVYGIKPEALEHDSSNDDVPLYQIAERHSTTDVTANGDHTKMSTELTKNGDFTKRIIERPKIPMSKLQQRMRERDPSYIRETNILTIVEFSYVCPFKCRHNHLLCYYCGENFSDPELLRNHTLNDHHPKKFKITEHKSMPKIDLTRIDCRLCPERISTLDEFKHHISSVHNKKFYFTKRDLVLPFRLMNNEFKCALCDQVYPYFHALNRHMNEHYSNYVCETCGLGFVDRGRFIMHQQRHEEGVFPCEVCGKIFKAQYNRELHVDRVHKKRGRVYCPKCDIRLMTYPQKLKHLVDVHGEEPLSFPCNDCDKVCETRRKLTIHRRKEHLKDFRYECQTCGQKFFTGFALRNHMPTHTGERNFKCKVCEKTYPRLKTLKEHIRIHTNDRRYRCHICGQAFIQNCSLKSHMKSQHPEYS